MGLNGDDEMIGALIFMSVMFIGYTYLAFALVDTLLQSPRLKKAYWLPVAIGNAGVVAVLTVTSGCSDIFAYICIGAILFLEFILFYKDGYLRCYFCMLAFVIHIMAMRSICVTVFALMTNGSLFEIINTPFLLVMSTAITTLILNVAICVVIKVVPAKGVRIINQHDNLLWFMVAWLTIFGAYLIANAGVYNTVDAYPMLLENQIFAPIAILIGMYIVLFFSMKTGELLGYKEKNEELEIIMKKEREYRDSMDKGVFRIIEVNFNQNLIISGFEDYEYVLGDMIYNYEKMLTYMIKNVVHPEDRTEFLKYVSPLTVVEEFHKGDTEIVFDYRRRMEDDGYVWMRVLVAQVEDVETGEIKGFVQIKDIDDEKKKQLDLEYKAERDLLTGLYNKGTVETLITERLASYKGKDVTGVVFIIDVDNFKTINDRLGHLYGDAVLSELSESLSKVFREKDIVGRIGGDEFLVFAEGLSGTDMIAKKAENICNAFLRTYANEKNEDYAVSSSVGIAVFPQDGNCFEVLFQCADVALYTTKAKGKNGYSFYNVNSDSSYVSTRTKIDTNGVVQKNFKENRIEYAFRLLYGSEDTKGAIESVLELIAKNFGFSRANIFEFNELSTRFNGVFEWCAVGIDTVSHYYIDMPVSDFDFIISALERSGGMFKAVPADFPLYAQESYTSIGIKFIVHFSIKDDDDLIGVIAFQNCVDENFNLSGTEFEELRTICQMLSIFMAKQLSIHREQRHHQAIEAVMDNMNSIAYVVDRENYDIFYENQNVVDITGHSSIGKKCHSVYRGWEEPCEDCPLQHISDDNPRCTLELYTEKFDLYTKTSAALIDWSNDRQSMLISSVDVTEYKKQDHDSKK